jgi:hypothetical protein
MSDWSWKEILTQFGTDENHETFGESRFQDNGSNNVPPNYVTRYRWTKTQYSQFTLTTKVPKVAGPCTYYRPVLGHCLGSIPGRVKISLFSKTSRLALDPSGRAIKWVPGLLSPG